MEYNAAKNLKNVNNIGDKINRKGENNHEKTA